MKLLSAVSLLMVIGTAIFAYSKANDLSIETKPNIIMIISDDMGRQDLSLYGSKLYETPNIDQLAMEGMRFDNAYVAHPRCVPSRIALLSGMAPTRLGSELINRKHFLPPENVTFAEHFQNAGYHTGYIGKWHLGKSDGGWPEHQGFEENMLAGSAGAPDNYFYPWGARSKNGKETFAHIKGTKGEYITDRLAQEAESFLERNKDKPFLMVLSHYSVHTPIQAHPKDVEYYKNKLDNMGVKAASKKETYDIIDSGDGISQYKTKQNHPVYAAMVGSVDKSVGKVLKKLESLKLTDNTIIMFTSDHGGLSSRGPNTRELATSNLPYRQGKGWLYDGGIRVPFIIKWPGKIKAGSVSQTQVMNSDHFPTMLEMGSLPLSPQDHLDGVSYMNALKGKEVKRPAMYFHSPIARPGATGDRNSSAIIDGEWKLIHWYDENLFELFHLVSDKEELVNLADKHPEKVKTLSKQLNSWLIDANAQYRKPGDKMKWDIPKAGEKLENTDGKFKW
ncbi:sulfatase [Thalassotalea crassostreae]|uniref:sulfatase n=1 Tax=Thalassotalea crassostreae TaxID=1763536 RepID=UPI00083990E3|nr:sulfatase [Thalassotalea crassostreae]